MHVNYVIFDIYDKVDIHGIGHMSMINMSLWVSKEASGPQDPSKKSLIKCLNDFSEFFFQITDFQNFPLYFLGNPVYN